MPKNIVFTNKVAENYEKYMAPMFFEPYAKDMASRLLPDRIDSILEIACGTGQVTRLLRERLHKARIVATDLNPGMLELAKKIINPEDKIKWLVADALELPFEEKTFKALVCQFGMRFLRIKQKGPKKHYQDLNPAGRFIIITWARLETNPAPKIAREVINPF